ncbi:anti-sigma regulatory factor [Ureibacillus manganicus]|uniref:Serine/threonine protein kinase n=1 Tax=Ureibacillus manganicus DSM 26584 TaxID=1384049 RepID=A0A0A3HTG5_9BACL|nr:anti-sigma regulatory factor [Ureibacillus manganicus]KGR75851.1 serine/threonine protein kinase [Ureibacillus manganicus DSM 26584]
MNNILEVNINTEWDIITARQIARETSKSIGFDTVDQARIVVAISEIAKNIFMYAKAGLITIERLESAEEKGISITAIDNGPGILDIKSVFDESNSKGLGAGLPGVKRLMDSLEIQSELGGGTIVRIEKWLR